MKKNQLFGILALMMALGMSFPATLFATSGSNNQASSTPSGSSSLETSANLESASGLETSPSAVNDALRGESTVQVSALPAGGQTNKKDKKEEEKNKKKKKTPRHDNGNDNNSGDNSEYAPDNNQPLAEMAINPGMVSSYEELVTLLTDPEFTTVSEIRLVNDIIIDNDIRIARETPTTIDLNGHSIISCGNEMVGHENARVIDVEHGMLTVTGEGSIMAMGLGGVAISIRGSINQSTANYAKVIIDQQVRLHAPNSYGIVIGQGASAAYGVAVELRGSISAQDGIYINGNVQGAGDNAPEIQLADHSVVNAEDTGIVAAGFANWRCGASTITSATGIKAYSGNFSFTNTQIYAGGEDLTNDGAGATFLFGGEAPENVNLEINGGIYESEKEYVFADYGPSSEVGTNVASLEISEGQFSSPVGVFFGFDLAEDDEDEQATVITVRGGNFSEDVFDFLAPDIHLEETADGRWIAVDEAALKLVEAKAELQAVIDIARAKDAAHYTEDSYQNLIIAIETCSQLLAQNELTLEQIDDISADLNTALDGLEFSNSVDPAELAAVRQELTGAIAAAKALDPNKYNTEDYHDFMDLIAEAEALLDEDAASVDDFDSILGEIDAMREILLIFDEEQAFTAAKLALEELIDQANAALSEVDPSDIYYDELRTALVEAASLLADDVDEASSDELEDAYAHIHALKEAFFAEEPVQAEIVSQSGFQNELEDIDQPAVQDRPEEISQDEALALPEDSSQLGVSDQPTIPDYPRDSKIPEYSESSDTPENTTDESAQPRNTDKTLVELRHGLAEMLAAVVNLTISDYRPEFTSQYYDLQAAISESKTLLSQASETSAALFAEVMNKVLVATSGLKDAAEPDASSQGTAQTSPNPVVHNTTALDVATLDTAVLSEIIAQIAQLDATKYTPESYGRIIVILEQAKTIIANPTTNQTDIDQIVLSLYRATTNLTPAQVSPASTSTLAHQSYPANPTQPNNLAPIAGTATPPSNDAVAPSLMMSALAGMYTGLAMYRKSRIAAKNAKLARHKKH